MEITNNIYTLAQQLFQLIQHQEMEITINQQTIRYQDTRKTLQLRTPKKTENMVDKIMKLGISGYNNFQKTIVIFTWDNTILQQLEHFVGKNNLSTQARVIYQIHTTFQDKSEILLNKAIDMITSNQLEKITNAQFEKLQTQITQVILKNKIQEIFQEGELHKLDFDRTQY
ncbi:hypothetical protein G9A89_006359 [Geosiphon pyriformis]|nr:hypothetical protein G9A89_006359 [Geosiphon pyriformis]